MEMSRRAQRNPVLKHPAVIFDRLVTLSQMPVVAAHDPGFSAWLVERRGPILAMIGEAIKERRGDSVQVQAPPGTFAPFATKGISPDRVYRVAPYMDQTDLQHPEMLVRVRPGPDPESAALLVEYMDMHRQAPPRGPFALDAKSVTGRESIANLLRHIDASKSLPDFPSVVAPPKREAGTRPADQHGRSV